ncbi:MAG: ATP-dependent DNA helicase RecG, partial [Gammaproteobacteria bacterium]|nr:ATP-dependent DNA helicase RecG [Gammaproteobacteria bacterium]
MITDPNQPIETLKGVGPSLRGKLNRLGIFRTTDLLLHLPMRYQDRTRLVPLRAVRAQQECLVLGQVINSKIAYGRRRSWVVTIEDDSGPLALRFFHFSKQQQASLRSGMYVRAFGEVRFGASGLEMTHPEYRVYNSPPQEGQRELTPVYHTTKGLGQARIRNLTLQLQAMKWPENAGTPYRTLLFLHAPPAHSSVEEIEAAREKIALDELIAYYLIMRHRQSDRAHQRTEPLPQAQQLGRVLLASLGFKLTGAQRRVTTEVLEDLALERPMLRLLQGDVGSGKTVVAAFAAIRAAEHGKQTALMAPTEILAEQHYLTFSNWLEPLGINVVLLTGRQTAKVRRRCETNIAEGTALVAVGTHALFQHSVVFKNLALVIVDEQHRFGVHQRMELKNKGRATHQLVMTATPIPRTLTMALYADMDVSLIDELPEGRQPIKTRTVGENRREEVVGRVGEVLAAGQQAYWVCPLIETSEQLEAAAAETTARHLRKSLPKIRVGLLHGRMPSGDKAQTMEEFK